MLGSRLEEGQAHREKCTHRVWDGELTCISTLTVVGIVPNNVVPSAPVPQKKSGVPGSRHDVAVPSDVRLRPGQTRHHIPVAKDNLSELSCEEKQGRTINHLLLANRLMD